MLQTAPVDLENPKLINSSLRSQVVSHTQYARVNVRTAAQTIFLGILNRHDDARWQNLP